MVSSAPSERKRSYPSAPGIPGTANRAVGMLSGGTILAARSIAEASAFAEEDELNCSTAELPAQYGLNGRTTFTPCQARSPTWSAATNPSRRSRAIVRSRTREGRPLSVRTHWPAVRRRCRSGSTKTRSNSPWARRRASSEIEGDALEPAVPNRVKAAIHAVRPTTRITRHEVSLEGPRRSRHFVRPHVTGCRGRIAAGPAGHANSFSSPRDRTGQASRRGCSSELSWPGSRCPQST
jgi:hypothetical protein